MELRYQALYQMNRVEARRKLLSVYEQLGSVSAARAAARCDTNGMLEMSILGYLGLRQMEELGKPFRYPPFGQPNR